MCVFYRWLLWPLLALVCSCAHAMTFHPKVGDSREYAVQIQMDIKVQGGRYDAQKISMGTIALMSYRVLSVTNAVAKVEVKPLFMDISSEEVNSLRFSSTDVSEHDERAALLQGGFIFDIELSSGKVLAMEAVDQKAWQELMQYSSGEELEKLINQQFMMPTITQQLRDEEGATLHLENFMNMADVTLTVDKVTADQVQLSITAQGQQNVLARMLVERKTGWPIEITMLSQQMVTETYGQADMRVALFMKQGRESLFASPINHILNAKRFGMYTLKDAQKEAEKLSMTRPLIEDEIFPQPTGIFFNDSQELTLLYINNLERHHTVGKFKSSQLTLLDSKGKTLTMELLSPEKGTFLDYQTMIGYVPLTWGKGKKLLEPIAQVKAKVDFYPSEMKTVLLDVSATQSSKAHSDGVDIELKPTDKQNVYLLTYTLSNGYWLNPHFIAGVGEDAIIHPANPFGDAFSWLAPEYASLIHQTSIDGKRTFYYKLSLPSKPKELTFFVGHSSDQVAFSKDLVFIDEKTYRQNVQLPPRNERTSLFMRNMESHFEELKPIGGGNVHTLQFKLPLSLAPYCELTVLNQPMLRGQPLQWSKIDDMIYDNIALWELQTADGIIQYFYGLTVNSQLLCNGYETWQEVAYERHPSAPWLLDLSQILNNAQDEKLDIKQPINTVYEKYRFLNARGENLLPELRMPKQEFENEDVLLNHAIEDFLVDGQYVRMTGVPVKIEKKIIVNEEVKNVWETHFDAIVCEEGDMACPN